MKCPKCNKEMLEINHTDEIEYICKDCKTSFILVEGKYYMEL